MNTKETEIEERIIFVKVETPERETKTQETSQNQKKTDSHLGWNGPEDPENPKNWKLSRKWAACITVSIFTVISPMSSSMIAPALPQMSEDLGIVEKLDIQMTMSIFVFALAVGPLIMGPLSEIYGRVIVIQISNLVYLVSNILCGFCTNKWQITLLRFISGLGGSAPLTIGGSVVSDLFIAEERGNAMSIYSVTPQLGPALGPILGAFIVKYMNWRWIFYATSIADILVQLAGLFFLQETYGPVLLRRKAKKLMKESGSLDIHESIHDHESSVSMKILTSAVRPFRLLATQPIVQVLSLYMSFLYGKRVLYILLSTFPQLWSDRYNEPTDIAGLNYISLGLGMFLGSQITARISDKLYATLKARNNNEGKPEFRVPLMIPGAILLPIGLFIYGWTAEYQTHWIWPNLGVLIFSFGSATGFQCISIYVVDSYNLYSASAMGCVLSLRACAGFLFPLFAPYMYNSLDYGWGNSLLAFIGIFIGIPSPILLWYYGPSLRAKKSPGKQWQCAPLHAMDANKADGGLSGTLQVWKDIDLSKLQRDLDVLALELNSNSSDSLLARKKLADLTKDFKKLDDSEKISAFKNLLKAYQNEIDSMSKRSKFSESAFLNLYKVLADAPDPVPLITVAANSSQQELEITNLLDEKKRLEHDLAESHRENLALKSAENNISILNKRLVKYEVMLEEMVKEKVSTKEVEMKQAMDEKIKIYKETEYSLQRQLNHAKDQLVNLQTSHDVTQAKLVDHSQKYDNEVAEKLGELEIVLMDLDQSSMKIAELEQRNV
ncbi:hypothetical protein HK096_002771, partial [Nowakowskiella sp. JEL0078]